VAAIEAAFEAQPRLRECLPELDAGDFSGVIKTVKAEADARNAAVHAELKGFDAVRRELKRKFSEFSAQAAEEAELAEANAKATKEGREAKRIASAAQEQEEAERRARARGEQAKKKSSKKKSRKAAPPPAPRAAPPPAPRAAPPPAPRAAASEQIVVSDVEDELEDYAFSFTQPSSTRRIPPVVAVPAPRKVAPPKARPPAVPAPRKVAPPKSRPPADVAPPKAKAPPRQQPPFAGLGPALLGADLREHIVQESAKNDLALARERGGKVSFCERSEHEEEGFDDDI
jgi:hypothetical protein